MTLDCRCGAQLPKCEPDKSNNLCPASSWRLCHDTNTAMQELYEFAERDKTASVV